MSNTARQYMPSVLDNIEDIENYKPGGFHPVHLGDIIYGTYKVLHKLGYGRFPQSLKILTANTSKDLQELKIVQRLATGNRFHPGYNYITTLLHHFMIDGPNGSHLCLVLQVAGPSIATFNLALPGQIGDSRRLRGDLARKIAKQTVQALDYIHSERICHGGLSSKNILFKPSRINTWTEEEVIERYGKPVKDAVLTLSKGPPGSSAPGYLVGSASITDPKFLMEEIFLIDSELPFPLDEPLVKENVSMTTCCSAPEIIFDKRLSLHSDIWAVGCVIFELRAGQALFSTKIDTRDDVLRQMVQTLGKLPDEWWNIWEARKIWFEENGKPKIVWDRSGVRAVECPLEEIISDIGCDKEEEDEEAESNAMLEPIGERIEEYEVEQLKELLEGIFKWIPEERSSLEQILNYSWFKLDDED